MNLVLAWSEVNQLMVGWWLNIENEEDTMSPFRQWIARDRFISLEMIVKQVVSPGGFYTFFFFFCWYDSFLHYREEKGPKRYWGNLEGTESPSDQTDAYAPAWIF